MLFERLSRNYCLASIIRLAGLLAPASDALASTFGATSNRGKISRSLGGFGRDDLGDVDNVLVAHKRWCRRVESHGAAFYAPAPSRSVAVRIRGTGQTRRGLAERPRSPEANQALTHEVAQ
jgi:hypothetical protein